MKHLKPCEVCGKTTVCKPYWHFFCDDCAAIHEDQFQSPRRLKPRTRGLWDMGSAGKNRLPTEAHTPAATRPALCPVCGSRE